MASKRHVRGKSATLEFLKLRSRPALSSAAERMHPRGYIDLNHTDGLRLGGACSSRAVRKRHRYGSWKQRWCRRQASERNAPKQLLHCSFACVRVQGYRQCRCPTKRSYLNTLVKDLVAQNTYLPDPCTFASYFDSISCLSVSFSEQISIKNRSLRHAVRSRGLS